MGRAALQPLSVEHFAGEVPSLPERPPSLITGELNAREVAEGSNFGLIESESVRDMLFEQEIRGIRVESPILAYLDLLGGEGRSKELAEHLRNERIGF